MRIAIPCDGEKVAEHFGRCEKYAVFDVEDGKILRKEIVESPEHRPNFLPRFLAEKGVQKLICCGIGPKALGLFEEFGIEVIAGVEGKVGEVIEAHNAGKLKSSTSKCEHFEQG